MRKGQDLILVTGATGQQGGATARELLAGGHKVRAMTRNPEGDAAKALAALGAEVVKGDLNDAASLERALTGAWGAYAVQNTWEAGVEQEEVQGKRMVEVAKKTGVRHYVYGSVGSAHRNTGIPHFDNKWRVEEAVRAAGLPSWTILRPVFFMENWSSPWFKPYIEQGNVAIGMPGDRKLQQIAVADIGKYAALAFEQHESLNGKAVDLAGDELSPNEVAAILSELTGKTLAHYEVPLDEVRKASEDFALMLEWFDRVGYDADITGNAERFGITPTRFREWAKTVAW